MKRTLQRGQSAKEEWDGSINELFKADQDLIWVVDFTRRTSHRRKRPKRNASRHTIPPAEKKLREKHLQWVDTLTSMRKLTINGQDETTSRSIAEFLGHLDPASGPGGDRLTMLVERPDQGIGDWKLSLKNDAFAVVRPLQEHELDPDHAVSSETDNVEADNGMQVSLGNVQLKHHPSSVTGDGASSISVSLIRVRPTRHAPNALVCEVWCSSEKRQPVIALELLDSNDKSVALAHRPEPSGLRLGDLTASGGWLASPQGETIIVLFIGASPFLPVSVRAIGLPQLRKSAQIEDD